MSGVNQPPKLHNDRFISSESVHEDKTFILKLNCKNALRWDAADGTAGERNGSGLGEIPFFKMILNVCIFYAAF